MPPPSSPDCPRYPPAGPTARSALPAPCQRFLRPSSARRSARRPELETSPHERCGGFYLPCRFPFIRAEVSGAFQKEKRCTQAWRQSSSTGNHETEALPRKGQSKGDHGKEDAEARNGAKNQLVSTHCLLAMSSCF